MVQYRAARLAAQEPEAGVRHRRCLTPWRDGPQMLSSRTHWGQSTRCQSWAYSDPAYSDPTHSDPSYSDPAYSDPAYSDPTDSDPTKGV